MSQLVNCEILREVDVLIYFKRELFTGFLYEELVEDTWSLSEYPINITYVKDGKRVGKYIPPYFPKHLFDLRQLQYLWIPRIAYGEIGFPDNFHDNYPKFTGLVFKMDDVADIPMPDFPSHSSVNSEKEWDLWNEEYKKEWI